MFKCAVAFLVVLIAVLFALTNAASQDSSFVLLDVHVPKTGFKRIEVCANYQQFYFDPLPQRPEDADVYDLGWWNNTQNQFNVCTQNAAILTNRIVPLTYPVKNSEPTGTCHRIGGQTQLIEYQMNQIVGAKAKSALFLLDKGVPSEYHTKNYLFSRFFNPKASNTTPTFYMYKEQFEEIIASAGASLHDQITFRFYRPADPFLDAGVIVILILSTGCILIGCLWYASSLKRKLDLGELKVDASGHLVDINEQDGNLPINSDASSQRADTPDENQTEKLCGLKPTGACVHLIQVLIGLIFVVVVLMLSFFFRPIAVEFFNVFIVIGATLSIQHVFTALIRNWVYDPEWRSLAECFGVGESRWIPSFFYRPFRPVSCFILSLGFAFSLVWRFNMSHPLAYLMLNFMNINICIYSVKSSQLRSLRLITFFLIAMFCYDIFMVFGTRLMTENGCSVMVQVVTGMDCTKVRKTNFGTDWPIPPIATNYTQPPTIPILFYVPLLSNPIGSCFDPAIEGQNQVMMLGLGDVIAPGYLIAFAFYLDVRKKNRFYLFGFTTLIGYALGMLTTFVSLKLMNTAQPALIYLVPFTLIPINLLCLYKGILREAWKGNIQE